MAVSTSEIDEPAAPLQNADLINCQRNRVKRQRRAWIVVRKADLRLVNEASGQPAVPRRRRLLHTSAPVQESQPRRTPRGSTGSCPSTPASSLRFGNTA